MPSKTKGSPVDGSKGSADGEALPTLPPCRIFDQIESKGSRRFLVAAVAAFAGSGYHATTTRDIAALAGSSPAGLYTYYATKEDLLFEIALRGHQHVLDETIAAMQSAEDPANRIIEVTRRSVSYHAEEHVLARVINADFRALDGQRLAQILSIRSRISTLVRDEVRRGAASGVFAVDHVEGATTAILRLMDVAPWYNDQGPMTPADLADVYVDLIMRMLGAREFSDRSH